MLLIPVGCINTFLVKIKPIEFIANLRLSANVFVLLGPVPPITAL